MAEDGGDQTAEHIDHKTLWELEPGCVFARLPTNDSLQFSLKAKRHLVALFPFPKSHRLIGNQNEQILMPYNSK